MNCFVTGATGYVGNFLIERLKKESHNVTLLVRNKTDLDFYISKGYDCFLGDLRFPDTIKNKFNKADIVFHLGNIATWWLRNKNDYFETNVNGTINLLNELEKTSVKKIIHVSSVAAIRQPKGIMADENSVHKKDFESTYSKSKYYAEKEVNSFVDKGLPIIILNPGVITGPNDFKTFGKTVIGIANKKIKEKFCPDSYIPLVHIDDVVEIMIQSMKSKPKSKYVIVGENIRISDVFDYVCEIMQIPKLNSVTPQWKLYLVSYLSHLFSFFNRQRPKLPIEGLKAIMIGAMADSSKSSNDFNFKYMNAKKILSKIIEWYREKKYIND